MPLYIKIRNTRGVTLVEVLITAIIGAVVAAGIVTFVSISGRSTDELAAIQVLQQESSMVSEVFLRSVRTGQYICKVDGGTCEKPAGDTLPATHIRINYPNAGDNKEIKLSNNMMEIINSDGSKKNISTRLCTTENTSSFTIQPFGEGVKLTLTIEYARKGKNYTFTTTIGSARCRNL